MVKMELWKVSDELWEKAEPLIPQPKRDPSKEYKRKSGGGRKPLPKKNVFEAILYIMRMRIQWKALPQDISRVGIVPGPGRSTRFY
jgi:transposase